ncbi:arylsulfatase [Lacticaseibacillus rhamnosus MTCC 5462]|nr:arylsulfatase [Lacticaseibacillus rhamnosus MTCC 5462]
MVKCAATTFGDYEGWRTEFHGEHSLGEDSSQYILTDNWKFIGFGS